MEKYLGWGLQKRDCLTVKATRGKQVRLNSLRRMDLQNDGRTSSLYKTEEKTTGTQLDTD